MRVLVFNGAPRFSGINMALSQAFVQAVTAHKVTVVQQHLHDIATDLGSAASLVQLSDNAAQAYQAVLDADLIIFCVPQHIAGLPGLFTHFFELLDITALRGKVALIAATGTNRYSAMLDMQLRPLLAQMGLFVMPMDNYLPHCVFSHESRQKVPAIVDSQALIRLRFSTQQAISLVSAKLCCVA